MCKILIVIFLLISCVVQSFGQLASWDLTIDGSYSQAALFVLPGNFKGGTGISTLTYSASGASASSWSTTTLDTSNYFQVSIAPYVGVKLTIQSVNFSERRSGTGIRIYEVQYSKTAAFTFPVTIATVNVPDDDLERVGNITGLYIPVNYGDTLYIRWYGYAAEGSTGTWRINDGSLSIDGLVTQANPNNTDSYVTNPTSSQIPAGNISSLSVTSVLAVPVFKVSVQDVGSGDGLPTKVTFITIRNPLVITGANWVNSIEGITLFNGVSQVNIQQSIINTESISLNIAPGDLDIPDGSSADITFSIYLKNTGLIDGSQFQFVIDHNNPQWDSDFGGSGFQDLFISDVVSEIFTLDVQATEMQFEVVPQAVWVNQNFSISIKATDTYNNLDVNSSNQISIQKQIGSGVLSSLSGTTQILSNGVYIWNDLKYDTPGYFSILITEQTSSLSQATSNLINCVTSGQILNESFTDGDFNANPAWFGETGDFIITPEYQLQLFTTATTDDTSYLVTPINLQFDSMEWQVYLKLSIEPSNDNYLKYYLISNNIVLKDTLKGYFIKIGENLSNDAIELFYQNGNTVTSICRGPNGQVAVNPTIRIKVIRANTGLWKIYADPTGGSSFELQASGTEASFMTNGFYSGVECRYTKTNASGKFTFDDFYCGPVQVDTIHPAFLSLSVIDSMHIDLTFDEGISLSTAQDTSNYIVNSGIGKPVSAIRDAMDYKVIHLGFSTAFSTSTVYTLSATGLFDFSGNEISQPVSQTFIWYKAVPNDIQINELMADPSPVIGLPDFEYIEIYNRTIYPIDITGWSLTIGSSTVVLPSKKLNPTKYILFCTSAAQTALQPYGDVLGIISSSSALTNAGTSIILKDKENQVISYVEFSDSWYRNSGKKDGGWSLEQIDPLNPCGEDANWNASIDPSGGTPGRKNSVYTSNTDNSSPEILRATIVFHDTLPLTPDTLLVTFSETIVSDGAINVANYNVNKGIGSPDDAIFTDITRKKVWLVFNQTFIKDSIYTITLTGEIKDCAGNIVTTSNNATFALADSLSPGCLIINEVLFNPYTGGTDYVELYNNTNNIYNLADLRLAVLDNTNQPSELFKVAPEGFYMFPGDYSVMSLDYKKVTQFYSSPGRKVFVEMSDMPSYNNSEGRVSIIDKTFNVIDDFSYSESMQFQLLNSFQGVSLERIHPDYPTQDQKNWHSAAESAGFGTPGYINSQYSKFDDNNSQITIEPEVFSPDNDGKDDLLNIRYKFDQPGFVANVTIFDARGRKVKRLIVSEMLATEGYFTWDGLNDYNQKASIGIYVIFIEVFNLDGKTSQFKKTCVLASHLN